MSWRLKTDSVIHASYITVNYGLNIPLVSSMTKNEMKLLKDTSVTGAVTTTGAVNGRNISTDGAALDLLNTRVDQSLLTTASPMFANVNVSGTVDNVDVAAFKADYDSKVTQDVRTSASPHFAGLSSSVNILELSKGETSNALNTGIHWGYGTGRNRGILYNDADNAFIFYREATSLPVTGTSFAPSTYADVKVNDLQVVGTVDGVTLGAFKTDYDAKVNQDVRTAASPTVNNLTVSSTTTLNNIVHTFTTCTTSTYNVVPLDTHILCSFTATAPVTVTVNTAVGGRGRVLIVKDTGGNAIANNITIVTTGAETIDGAANFVLNINYQMVRLISDGANWFTIA